MCDALSWCHRSQLAGSSPRGLLLPICVWGSPSRSRTGKRRRAGPVWVLGASPAVGSRPLASCSWSRCRGGCRVSSACVPRKRPQLARRSHARSQWQHLAALSGEVCLPESRCILGLPEHRKVFMVLPPRPGHR